jgi:thioesterase domain-containing protein
MFWGYNNLARALGVEQPVFGFQSRGLDGEPEFEQIEEMARHYVRELQAVQPAGPYYLGGYCFGGVVAYEMACQLHDAGEQVAQLFLINSNPLNSSYTTFQWTPRLTCRFVGNLLSRAALSFALPPRYRREFVRRNVCLLANRVRRVFDNECSCGPALDELLNTTQYTSRQQQVWETHVRALANYRPRQYPGPLTLFRSRVHHLFCSFDPACGWREFARGGVDLHIIPGAHETVMDEPYVRELAREVRRALERVNGSRLSSGSLLERPCGAVAK